jgi:hypothetical protein
MNWVKKFDRLVTDKTLQVGGARPANKLGIEVYNNQKETLKSIIQHYINDGTLKSNFLGCDLGCGYGVYGNSIAKHFSESTVVGVDVFALPVDEIEKRVPNFHQRQLDILTTVESSIQGDLALIQNIWHCPDVLPGCDDNWFRTVEFKVLNNYKVVIVNISTEQYEAYSKGSGFYNSDLKIKMHLEKDTCCPQTCGQYPCDHMIGSLMLRDEKI